MITNKVIELHTIRSKRGIPFVRGGDADEVDDEGSDEDDEYESEENEDENETVEVDEDDSDDESLSSNDQGDFESEAKEFDETMVMSPTIQLYSTLASILISRRLDLSNSSIVRALRFAFIAQIVLKQLLVLHVRMSASRKNDRTAVKSDSLLPKMLSSVLKGADDSTSVIKNLASAFLSAETTVVEYDLKYASKMQGGVLMNMLFMWVLHFKMNKVQPMLMQILSGSIQLIYNPLFQVYCLGRNIERPFQVAPSLGKIPSPVAEQTEPNPQSNDENE